MDLVLFLTGYILWSRKSILSNDTLNWSKYKCNIAEFYLQRFVERNLLIPVGFFVGFNGVVCPKDIGVSIFNVKNGIFPQWVESASKLIV